MGIFLLYLPYKCDKLVSGDQGNLHYITELFSVQHCSYASIVMISQHNVLCVLHFLNFLTYTVS